jgi:hypothetical protein
MSQASAKQSNSIISFNNIAQEVQILGDIKDNILCIMSELSLPSTLDKSGNNGGKQQQRNTECESVNHHATGAQYNNIIRTVVPPDVTGHQVEQYMLTNQSIRKALHQRGIKTVKRQVNCALGELVKEGALQRHMVGTQSQFFIPL